MRVIMGPCQNYAGPLGALSPKPSTLNPKPYSAKAQNPSLQRQGSWYSEVLL